MRFLLRQPGAPKPAAEAYQALAAELDRLDPAGAARRRQEEVGIVEKLRRGLEAQFGK